jgi:streptogramin lyase
LWFTVRGGSGFGTLGKIGRITPKGVITEFPMTTLSNNPDGLTAGPGGVLWFTDYSAKTIGKVTTSGQITEFSLSLAGNPDAITTGPDGNVWFTESGYDANRFIISKFGRASIFFAGVDLSSVPSSSEWTTLMANFSPSFVIADAWGGQSECPGQKGYCADPPAPHVLSLASAVGTDLLCS